MITALLSVLLLTSHPRPAGDFSTFKTELEKPCFEESCLDKTGLENSSFEKEALAKPLFQVELVAFDTARDIIARTGQPYTDLLNSKRLDELSPQEQQQLKQDLRHSLSSCSVLVVDIGESISLEALELARQEFPHIRRYAYYDKAEPWVSSAYSSLAAKICPLAQKILFANADLTSEELLDANHQPLFKQSYPYWGLGYYPMQGVKQLRQARENQALFRSRLLQQFGQVEASQKILVYAGGATDEYFDKAWPEFLEMLKELKAHHLADDWIVLLQQHPRANQCHRDDDLLRKIVLETGLHAYVSPLSFIDAFACADAAVYYQTTSNIQFVLAGLKTLQVGASLEGDQTVLRGFVPSIKSAKDLYEQVNRPFFSGALYYPHLEQQLGIRSDFATRLRQELEKPLPSP